jgi:hypothetical protein
MNPNSISAKSLRHALTGIGAALVASGILTQETVAKLSEGHLDTIVAIGGAVFYIGGWLWSLKHRK